MSPRKQPVSLLSLCQQSIERSIISCSVTDSWVESVGLALPYNIADQVAASVLASLPSSLPR